MSVLPSTYEVVIKPRQSWLKVDWQGLVEYRDLLFLLVRRDFLARYKQTILGPAWFVISPIITTLVYTLVFGRMLGVSTGGVPPMLFYLSGLVGWSYFAGLVTQSGNTLISNAQLFGKVYFPRLIVPFSVAVSTCLTFAIQLGTFLVILAINISNGTVNVGLTQILTGILVMPLILLHMAFLGLGIGFLLASLTAKYRDFQHLVHFMVNLWMYATPIIYPASRVPEQFIWIARLNPMAPVVEAVRSLFLGTPWMHPYAYVYSGVVAVLIFIAGMLIFQRTARTFIDTV